MTNEEAETVQLALDEARALEMEIAERVKRARKRRGKANEECQQLARARRIVDALCRTQGRLACGCPLSGCICYAR